MHENGDKTHPQVGWIQVLREFMKSDLEIINLGRNKISTRTAITLGIFDQALALIDKETYVLLGYGHNDSLLDKEERYCTPEEFFNNLEKMIEHIEALGGKTILLTPTYKVRFDDNGILIPNVLGEYPIKIRELAFKKNLMLVDLTKELYELYSLNGKEKSQEYVMTFDKGIYKNYINGSSDDTHLRRKGAVEVVKIFLNALNNSDCELKKYIK